jgi:hypothetical protein
VKDIYNKARRGEMIDRKEPKNCADPNVRDVALGGVSSDVTRSPYVNFRGGSGLF